MLRFLYAIGLSYIAICLAAIVFREPDSPPAPFHAPAPAPPPAAAASRSPGLAWFQTIKPFCNAVEVETQQRATPAPHIPEGLAYSAACYALGGKIEHAHAVIDSMPAEARSYAAAVVFNVGHPVADAGDNTSAGPIMRLVLDYQPDNYMALYHAGMAEWTLHQPELAKGHLQKFLKLYSANDYFHSSAIDALHNMGVSPE